MPTSDAAAATPANALILLAACALAGAAVALLIYVGAVALNTGAVGVAAAIGEAQRRGRRPRGETGDALFDLAMSMMPAVVPIVRRLPIRSVRASLAERYALAGWPGGLEDDEVVGLALLIGLGLAVLAVLALLVIKPLAAPLGLLAVAAGPGLVSSSLGSRRTEREGSIARTMPFALDVLVLSMRAGASFPAALQQAAEDFAGDPIGVELKAVLTDLELGVTTRDALEGLARRVPIPAVRFFVDDVLQSEELGRPVADSLEHLADRTRTRRVQDAVDTAGRARVMVLIPGTLILLASLIVLFSPFIVRFIYGGYTSD
jgi:tight adherence protein C